MGEIKDLVVPIEIAKQLKEKGFDIPCITCYDKCDMLSTYSKDIFNPIDYSKDAYCVSAPLYDQVLEWLREVHKIHLEVSLGHDENNIWYNGYLHRLELGYNYNPIDTDDISGDTYKEVLIAGIEEALKLI